MIIIFLIKITNKDLFLIIDCKKLLYKVQVLHKATDSDCTESPQPLYWLTQKILTMS